MKIDNNIIYNEDENRFDDCNLVLNLYEFCLNCAVVMCL